MERHIKNHEGEKISDGQGGFIIVEKAEKKNFEKRKKFNCSLCAKTYTTKHSLNQHMEIRHKITKDTIAQEGLENVVQVNCEKCNDKFADFNAYNLYN